MSKIWAYCNFINDTECENSLSMLDKLQAVIENDKFDLEVIVLGLEQDKDDIPIKELRKLNVSKVFYVVNDMFNSTSNYSVYVEAMQNLLHKNKPEYLIFDSSSHSRIVAAQVATAMESGLTAECSKYYVNENNQIVQVRPTFEGNTYAHIITRSDIKMSTTLPSLYKANPTVDEGADKLEVELIELELHELEEGIYVKNDFIDSNENYSDKKLEKYNMIFAAGMGLGCKENVDKLKELAKRYNAGFGASRSVIEMGWADWSDLIGMSGSYVSPELYIAFGISGSLQHVEGMRDSSKIVSINTDRNAPLHRICNSVIIANAINIIDYLLEKEKNI